MKNKQIGKVFATLFFCFIALVTLRYFRGNYLYFKYKDQANMACKNADFLNACHIMEKAINFAKDDDLINEGLHYKLMFKNEECF